jgi:hypothetical protein
VLEVNRKRADERHWDTRNPFKQRHLEDEPIQGWLLDLAIRGIPGFRVSVRDHGTAP